MTEQVQDILIYAHYAPPYPSASATRMLSLARHLTRKGHHVKLLTSQPGPLFHEGQQIIRCTGRLGLMTALWRHKRCPILISSPPGTPAAEVAMMARLLGYRVIVDIRDPYVSEALANGDIKPGLATSAKRWLERQLFHVAHGISYVSVPLKNAMELHFGRPRVPQGIAPNGIDRDIFYKSLPDRQNARHELGLNTEPLFVYAGILGGKALDETFEALAPALRQGAKLLVIGVLDEYSEPIKVRLQKISATLGVESQIIWRFNANLKEVAYLLNACDIGVNPLPGSRSYCLPVKTFEYLSCGLYPLSIASGDSALSAMFPEESKGVLCTNWREYSKRAERLAAEIDELRARADERAEFAKQFDREKANKVLADLLIQSRSV
ncbi:glycosyltransferase [Patescibacteria group bacterium]|nr:MAG: glycosyltransferase [Patescibacteria group bacterium]